MQPALSCVENIYNDKFTEQKKLDVLTHTHTHTHTHIHEQMWLKLFHLNNLLFYTEFLPGRSKVQINLACHNG